MPGSQSVSNDLNITNESGKPDVGEGTFTRDANSNRTSLFLIFVLRPGV
jgi:hypothetical protein